MFVSVFLFVWLNVLYTVEIIMFFVSVPNVGGKHYSFILFLFVVF